MSKINKNEAKPKQSQLNQNQGRSQSDLETGVLVWVPKKCAQKIS